MILIRSLTRWSPQAAAMLLCLAVLPCVGFAQPGAAPSPPANRLGEAVYEEESVGLTMRLPEGVKVTRNPQSTQRLLVEPENQLWVATLEVILTRSEEETLKSVTDRAIETSLQPTEGSRQQVKESKQRYRKTIKAGEQEGEQFAVELSLSSDIGIVQEVRIYSIFNPSPGTFVVYGVRGDGARADEIISLTQAAVETFRFRDPAEVARELQEGIDATKKALSRLGPEEYRGMLVPDTWYRMYRKAGGAEQEVAYYRIREDIGPRGLVGENRDPERFSPDEKEEGLLVSQTARFLVAGEAGEDAYVSEVESLAWMSFDRQREIWYTRQVSHEKSGSGYVIVGRSSISGTRQGGRIDVVVDVSDGRGGSSSFATPEAYVSQAEQHLLYRILNPGQEGSYVMYLFRPQTTDVKRRTEIIKAMSSAERLTVESRTDTSLPPTIKTITAKGEIVRMISPEGLYTEPSDPSRLQQLWRASGLPTGEIRVIADRSRPGR